MQKLAVSIGEGGVQTMLDAMDPGGWVRDIRPIKYGAVSGEIGVISNPQVRVQTKAGVGPGLIAVGGDVMAVSGLPLRQNPAPFSNVASAIDDLKTCDGAFAAVIWDATAGCLSIVMDFMGFQPLYTQKTETGFRAATETKAFHYRPNAAGWGAFLTCGHMLERVTLLEGVELAPGGHVITYDAAGGSISEERHWNWPQPGKTHHVDYADAMAPLRANMEDYLAIEPGAICLLSGGFDSRLILFMLKDFGITPDALIMTHKDEYNDCDGRLAVALAKATNTPYRIVDPDLDFFSKPDFLDFVWANEGATPSLYLFIAQLMQYVDPPAVWEGLIPAHTLRTVHQPPGGFDGFRTKEAQGQDGKMHKAARAIFRTERYEEMVQSFEAAWQRSKAHLDQDDEGMWRWVAENRMRNRTGVNPFKAYANRTAPFVLG
ncbi:MAG: hypothetical protein AAGF15_01970, partial [Pseudomonadota bacterium]